MRLYQKQSVWALLNPFSILHILVGQRRLLWQFTRRNIEMQHKGSFLGLTWTLLSPLLMFAAYAFVFLAVFNSRFGVVAGETRTDYAIGLFLGLSLIQLFQESMSAAPGLIVQSPNFVKKIVFPLEILPAAMVAAAVFRSIIAMGLVIIAAVVWGPGVHNSALYIIPLFACLVLISLGVAWALAAIGVFLRDVAPIVQFASVLLMFGSAVFYSYKSIPEAFSFLRYNPLLLIIEYSRSSLLWGLPPTAMDLAIVITTSCAVCIAGYALFAGLKSAFSDVL